MNILRPNTARNIPAPPAAPSIKQLTATVIPAATQMRLQRNVLIAQVDWMRTRHTDQLALGHATSLTGAQYTQLLTYIQALRDVPANSPNPASPVWPAVPSFVSASPI